MSQTHDNPAARLHALLMDLHATHPRPQERQQQAWNAICSLLNVAPDSPDGLHAVADVVRLPRDIVEAVNAHVDDEEERQHLLEGMPLLERSMIAVTTRHPLAQVLETFAPGGNVPLSGVVRDLSSISRILHRAAPAAALTEEELDHLRALITELMEQVINASIDVTIQSLLLSHLRKMLEAVQLVRIGGREAIEDELDAIVGVVVRRPEEAVSLQKVGLLDKLKAWVDTMNGLLSLGTGATQLGQAVARAIEM